MVQRLEGDEARRLDLCRWVIANRRLISFILFTDEASFTHDGINNTHNSHRWSDKNPYAVVERNSQHRFSVNVWCGVLDNQLIGPAVLPNRFTGCAYVVDFLQNELPLLLEVPLAKRMRMVFQHDGAPAHFSHLVTSSKSNIPRTMDRPRWSRSLATKVPRPYSFRYLSVGMDEKRSLQRKSKHKRRIGRSHYE